MNNPNTNYPPINQNPVGHANPGQMLQQVNNNPWRTFLSPVQLPTPMLSPTLGGGNLEFNVFRELPVPMSGEAMKK